MNQQEIIEFILNQQSTNSIWPWFVSAEEMVGNPLKLREAEKLLTDMDITQGVNHHYVYEALTEVFGANPFYIKEQQRMPYGLFTIVSEGKTQHYCAQNFGKVSEILDLLHRVHTAKQRVPNIMKSDAERLLLYSKSMIPIAVYPSQRLFVPIAITEAEEMMDRFQTSPSENTAVVLDYDNDYWEHTIWTQAGLERLSAPMSEAISAFEKALQRKGRSQSYQNYLNESALITELENICKVTVTPNPSEQQNYSPTMQM